MRIITPTGIEIEEVAWEGYLEPLGQTYRKDVRLPRVTLGRPAWWPAGQAVADQTGQVWSPPSAERAYTLVRLACTLHPPALARSRYSQARLTAYLRPKTGPGSVIAHDLYPQRVEADSRRKYTVSLGPELKFAELVDLSLGEVGAEIEVRQVFPVIQGYGLAESRPYWDFGRHASHPLLGSQSVYFVAAAPREAGGFRLTLELAATLETRFGPVRLAPPQTAQASLSWLIEG